MITSERNNYSLFHNGIFHFKENVPARELLFQLGFHIDWHLFGNPPTIYEIAEVVTLCNMFPIKYTPPSVELYDASMPDVSEGSFFGYRLNAEAEQDPNKRQAMMNVSIEYYKFTGERLWAGTFDESYDKFFRPFKNEHKKRLAILQKLISDYWAANK